ncbi:hypothetical protein KIPB_003044 [Kipferlia bialata]|uniref:Uncharacterized protein n=1 Tax=Kipferlia bialata TaxID=797122 RepID=A0A9K3CTU2_9EUKA|nr:hypothetical protein KIPB_003044 [Kipferlia bialata]|eukprot:g3044.t1
MDSIRHRLRVYRATTHPVVSVFERHDCNVSPEIIRVDASLAPSDVAQSCLAALLPPAEREAERERLAALKEKGEKERAETERLRAERERVSKEREWKAAAEGAGLGSLNDTLAHV